MIDISKVARLRKLRNFPEEKEIPGKNPQIHQIFFNFPSFFSNLFRRRIPKKTKEILQRKARPIKFLRLGLQRQRVPRRLRPRKRRLCQRRKRIRKTTTNGKNPQTRLQHPQRQIHPRIPSPRLPRP